MKFTCLQQNLKEGLGKVGRAVSQRTTLPILSNVFITAEQGALKLAASNLETTIVTWVGSKVEEEGSVTVPAKVFTDFINSLPEGTVEGEATVSSLKISASNATSRFNGMSADEFPELPSASDEVLFSVKPDIFEKAVRQTVFASAVDDSRPVLTGVLFNVTQKDALLVGVDGFRLSETKLELDKKPGSQTTFIIPSKILNDVSKLMVVSDEPVKVAMVSDKNQVVFYTTEQVVSSRLLDGEFPNYKDIMPSSSKTKAVFNKNSFQEGVKLASIFARDSANIVRVNVDKKNSRVTLSANAADIGENESVVNAKVEGESLETAFNSRYMSDLLNNVNAESFAFESGGTTSPGVFKVDGMEGFVHIIMPVRLND